ncbi:hypothetical protein ACFYPW_28880 [Micromonospora zamorensis]
MFGSYSVLPPDHQIVYKEMQKYLFKVGPVDLPDGPRTPRRGRESPGP